jgi:hypothetical protein
MRTLENISLLFAMLVWSLAAATALLKDREEGRIESPPSEQKERRLLREARGDSPTPKFQMAVLSI